MTDIPQLATCSWAAYEPDMGTAVRISLGAPRGRKPPGRRQWIYVAELAPRRSYFHAADAEFDRQYLAQLDRFADLIAQKLSWLKDQEDEPLVLLCFERKIRGPQDCHRRLFADWWSELTGQEVPELDARGAARRQRQEPQPEPEPKRPEIPGQLSLIEED